MSDNELLLAISNMMDKKLTSELQPIKSDLQLLKGDVQGLKEDVQVLKEDVQGLKEDVQVLKEDVQGLKEDVQVLKEDVRNLEENMQTLEKKVHQIQLCQENVILPRLNTIESCYTGTYSRYRNYADRMEVAFDDIEMLKKVVAEHSEKLQKLA